MQLAQLLHIAGGVGLIDLHGLQTHGAVLHAAAAADAGVDLCGLCSCLAQQDQTGSGLGGGVGKVLHSGAHHGTAGNNLAQLALNAHIVQNVLISGAHGHNNVLGLCAGIAVHGDGTLDHRHTGSQILAQRGNAGHVRQGLNYDEVKELRVILPSDAEQSAIVSYLDEQCAKIDAILNETKSSIEEYKNWKYSIISETVSKGLVSTVDTQTTGLISFTRCPVTWKVMRIKDIACVLRGGSPRPIDAFLTDSDNGYNWIKIGDTIKGRKIISSTKQKIKPEGLSKTRLVHKGDLLLTNSMSFGQPYILGIDGCIHDGWVCLSDIKFVSREFLYYFLCSELCMMQFHLQVTGGVVQNLNVEKIGNTKIFVPSVDEQDEIVKYLEQRCQFIEALIDEKESVITDLENYKKSLIYEVVTGKRKVV